MFLSIPHPHRAESLFDMSSTKLLAVCIGMFSLIMTGVGSEMEAQAIKAISTGHTYAGRYGTLAADDKESKLEIVRDRFLMFLAGGGSFAGAAVCVILRRAFADQKTTITREMMAAWFTVSFLSALFCSPAFMRYYCKSDTPELMFFVSFSGAVVVWGFWECAFILVGRFKKAATDRGIGGLKDEITGNTATVNVVPAQPQPSPVVPTGDKS